MENKVELKEGERAVPGFQPGQFKGTPKRIQSLGLVYQCTGCVGRIFAIRAPENLHKPAKCNNCGMLNTKYKIKNGHLCLIKYRLKNLWQRSIAIFVKSARTNSEVK